jgi:hypothetical protein
LFELSATILAGEAMTLDFQREEYWHLCRRLLRRAAKLAARA